jgi:nucleoside-diphosphate-sugar epimerase
MKAKVLVIGANGQLGSVLVKELQQHHGLDNVVASDLKKGTVLLSKIWFGC